MDKLNPKYLTVCLLLCIFSYPLFAQGNPCGNEAIPAQQGSESAVKDYINLYRRFISNARGSKCAMYPSCSTFGLMVFNELPFWEAMALTADRLTRCSHDRKYYSETFESGYLRLLDYPAGKTPPSGLAYRPAKYLYADSYKAQDNTKIFIQHLINRNHYDLALLEIERELCFKPDCDSSFYLNKLLCYDALNREEAGIMDYESNFPPAVKNNRRVVLKVAKLYYGAGNGEMALKTLRNMNAEDNETNYKSLVLQGIIETQRQNFNQAKSLFQESSNYTDAGTADKNIRLVENLEKANMKNPATARLLSVIPGAGYAYTKNYQNAITSFIINSLLGYATYTSIKEKNYGVASIMGVFSVSFFAGNILGAGNSADRYNKYIINRGVKQLNINNQIIHY
jgi:putative component of membrane protein insertase Oxa1/YidC/SpoIIIJ protein YidD